MNFTNDNNSLKGLAKRSSFDNNIFEKIIKKENSNNILFCEDADVSFSLIKNILSKIKYKVTQVKDEMDAYNLIINNYNHEYIDIDRDMFCLIIMDLNISRNIKCFGYKILQKMKEDNIYIPTIIYSGQDDIETITKCMRISPIVKDFFSKNNQDSKETERFLTSVEKEITLFKDGKIE